jgi:hypothetical protein
MDEVTRGWRKLHEEFHNLYSLPDFVRLVKSGRMRWVEHVASTCRGDGEMLAKFWLGSLKGRDHLEDLDIGGR